MALRSHDSATRPVRSPAGLNRTITIAAPPARILSAFFDHRDLKVWWQVVHSVTTPRALGAYAIEWAATEFRDETLGRLGGTFHGTVMQDQAGQSFFVADVYWLPPDGEPIGPMALEVTCKPADSRGWLRLRRPRAAAAATLVHVVQNGFEDSPRWRRYYDVVGPGWARALDSLKTHLERDA